MLPHHSTQGCFDPTRRIKATVLARHRLQISWVVILGTVDRSVQSWITDPCTLLTMSRGWRASTRTTSPRWDTPQTLIVCNDVAR